MFRTSWFFRTIAEGIPGADSDDGCKYSHASRAGVNHYGHIFESVSLVASSAQGLQLLYGVPKTLLAKRLAQDLHAFK